MLDGLSSSRKKPGFPANMWVEVWVEKGVVWVDKIYVDGIFICLSLTHKFVPFRQQRRGKSRVAVILSSLWWNPSTKVVASPLWDGCEIHICMTHERRSHSPNFSTSSTAGTRF